MKRNNAKAKEIMASVSPLSVRRIETRMLVAKMLYDYLKTRGVSQRALAGKMGKQPSEVSKWLSGNHNFTIDTLSDIGYYLGVDFLAKRDTFLFRCDEETELSRPGIKEMTFETFRVSNSVLPSATYHANSKKAEICLA